MGIFPVRAIAGVLSYYLGAFIGGLILGLYFFIRGTGSVEDMNDLALNLMALPFGILGTVGFYYLLKGAWQRKAVAESNILDEEI